MDGSAYAVAARIGGVKPRVAGHATVRDTGDPSAVLVAADVASASDRGPAATGEPPAVDEFLGDRWSAFRDRCSQLTFYLFDADGWR